MTVNNTFIMTSELTYHRVKRTGTTEIVYLQILTSR
jgi:hypothetical protein